jgi:hypothetical protein
VATLRKELTMRLVTTKELRIIYGIPFTPQHLLRLQKMEPPRFPLRRKVGNVNFYVDAEVEEWIAKLWKPGGHSKE